MCGIAGIINKENLVEKSDLKKMTDKMVHRGPDAEGFYVDGKVGFGHRRLAILDLSAAANQPLDYKGKYVLTFNGVIYNYLELKKTLETQGYNFVTTSDTEVLIAAYDYWGENCVQHFNGMWSFAIHDKITNKVFCSRDRFGVKPFYYHNSKNRFIFASEIKPILELERLTSAKKQVVLDYIILGISDFSEATFFDGIIKLLPGQNLVYNLQNDKFQISDYYRIPFLENINKKSLQESEDLLEEFFTKSVDIRLRADVKVGCSLSGGIDSSYMAAIISKKLEHKEVNCFTIGSLHKSEDETKVSHQIAEDLQLKHQYFTPTRQDFEENLERVIYHQEEPFGGISVYMQNFLMQKAHNSGVKVLLDGQGADEILLGYCRYVAAHMQQNSAKQNFKFLQKMRKTYSFSPIHALKLYLFFTQKQIQIFYYRKKGEFLKKQFREMLNWYQMEELTKRQKDIFTLQSQEMMRYNLQEMLKWEDKNSMQYSIETRLPYLDFELVEMALSFNNNYKIYNGWSKFVLRKNLKKYLPSNVAFNNTKIAFNAPIQEWWPPSKKITETINNSAIIQELFKDKFTKINDRDFEWRLYNLAIWEKLYGMKI